MTPATKQRSAKKSKNPRASKRRGSSGMFGAVKKHPVRTAAIAAGALAGAALLGLGAMHKPTKSAADAEKNGAVTGKRGSRSRRAAGGGARRGRKAGARRAKSAKAKAPKAGPPPA